MKDAPNTKPEIERKFLLSPHLEVRAVLTDAGVAFKDSRICQDYLYAGRDREARVRRIRTGRGTSYVHTVKTLTDDPLVRVEGERNITEAEYSALMQNRLPELHQISKSRVSFFYLGQLLEVDVFKSHPGLIILEMELTTRKQAIALPRYLPPIREVTEDDRFKNASLARHLHLFDILPSI